MWTWWVTRSSSAPVPGFPDRLRENPPRQGFFEHPEYLAVRTLEAVEFATLTWVDWFNTRRLLGPLGDIPPAEFEAQYYEQAEVA